MRENLSKLCKPLTLTVAALMACTPALAQVTLSGYFDVNLELAKSGGKTVKGMSSGGMNTSRLQFKAHEHLGQGLSVTGVHELAFKADSGQMGSPRHTYIQLASKQWGELSAGRRDTPTAEMYGYIDPTFNADYSPISNTVVYYAPWRESNGVYYTSPRVANVQARVAMTAGREDGSKDAKVQSAALDYYGNDFYLMAGVDQQHRRTLSDSKQFGKSTDIYVGGVLTLGNLDLTALYHRYSGYYAYPPYADFNAKGTDLQLGLRYEINPTHRIFASVVHKDDKDETALSDATSWTLGYLYGFSKRTDLYTVYGSVKHARASEMRFPVSFNHASPLSNENPSGLQIGLRHKF